MVRGVERLHVEGVCGRGCQSELFETFAGREYRENVVFEIAEVLIGGDESARLVIVREDVAAVKTGVVSQSQQREECGHQVDLRDGPRHDGGCE